MSGRTFPSDTRPAPQPVAQDTTPPAEFSGFGEEYLNHVTHELRASLNTILGWAELLRTRNFDEAGRVRAAETILRHGRQQLWLVGDLMDTWRLLSGTLRLNAGPVDLRGVVEAAVQAIEPIAGVKDITLNLDLAPLSGHVQGDAQRLKQAILAVLSNAVHFMSSPGTIEVRLAPSAGGAELTVRDSGLSVRADALPYLFDRHRPKDASLSSRRGEFGVGLGLIRDVIDLHGGSVHVDSDGQRGVTFTICLPLDTAPQAVSSDPVWVQRGGPADHPMHCRLLGLTVLLVDDEPDAREVIAGILKHYGAVVMPAASVSDALTVLGRERVDVVLTDIAMPGEDGYDLIQRMRKLDHVSGVPAAALTAFASEEDRRRALASGFQVHLSKPIDPRVLVETVEALGRRTPV